MEENLTRLPAEVPSPRSGAKRAWGLLRLAWVLPIVGALLVVLAFEAPSSPDGPIGECLVAVWAMVALVGLGCFPAGAVFIILGFVSARKYSNALPNALAGCVVILVIAALFVHVVLVALSQLKDFR